MLVPKQIKRNGTEGIEIIWNDNSTSSLNSKLLREHCPSAENREKRGDRTHQKPLSGGRALLNVVKHSLDEELKLIKIEPVGNYAIRLIWADGHNSGIYSYHYLRELAENDKS